jgi:hypothetical protein
MKSLPVIANLADQYFHRILSNRSLSFLPLWIKAAKYLKKQATEKIPRSPRSDCVECLISNVSEEFEDHSKIWKEEILVIEVVHTVSIFSDLIAS